jgi:hypothetical protein
LPKPTVLPPKEKASLDIDLTLGFSEFVEHVPHQNGIDSLLKFILENKSALLMDSDRNGDK